MSRARSPCERRHTRSDAELDQAVLAAAGIYSAVIADDAGGAYPFDLTGAARLIVDQGDEEDATAILSGHRVRYGVGQRRGSRTAADAATMQ